MAKLRIRLVIAAALAAFVVLAATALAQGASLEIPRWLIAAGGGSATGGEISLVGSLGQPIVGSSGGGNMALDAGFWQGLSVLAVSKSDGLEHWYASWNFSYTIVVTNTGTVAAEGLVVTDTLPAGVYITSLPTGATQGADGTIRWSLGTLEAGQALTLTLPVRTFSTVRGAVTNLVTAACTGGISARATDTTVIVAAPTAVPSATATPTATSTPRPSATATATATATVTPDPTATATTTATPEATATPSATATVTATATATVTTTTVASLGVWLPAILR